MLKSNLNLTNRSTNDLMREFNVFLITNVMFYFHSQDRHLWTFSRSGLARIRDNKTGNW